MRTGEMALYGGAVPGDLLDLILIALAAATLATSKTAITVGRYFFMQVSVQLAVF